MSNSQRGAGSGQQSCSKSTQDMVAEKKLSVGDIEALRRATTERLGEGGFGEASLVMSGKFKGYVVKKMQPRNGLDWKMFHKEVETMTATSSIGGVVKIIGWWEHGRSSGNCTCGIVMDNAGQMTLREMVGEKMADEVKHEVAGQLLNTLMLFHTEGGYSHNDISMSNIMVMLDPDGDEHIEVRLIDFGCATRNLTIKDKEGVVISTERSLFPWTNKEAYWCPFALHIYNAFKMGALADVTQNGWWTDAYATVVSIAQLYGEKLYSQYSINGLTFEFPDGCFEGAKGFPEVFDRLTTLHPLKRWGVDDLAASEWFQHWSANTSYTGKKMVPRPPPNSRYAVHWRGHVVEVLPEEEEEDEEDEEVAHVQVSVDVPALASSSQVPPQLPSCPRSGVAGEELMESATQVSLVFLRTESVDASNEGAQTAAAAAIASSREVTGVSEVTEEGRELSLGMGATAGKYRQVGESAASLDELCSRGEEAMVSISPGTAVNDHYRNLSEQVVQHSVNAQVGETKGAAFAGAGFVARVAASKRREGRAVGTGTSRGGGRRNVAVARIGNVACKVGRADGGANAKGSGKMGMRLRSATQAKPTAATQNVGPLTRSMVSRDREVQSTAAKANRKGINGGMMSTRDRTVGGNASRRQTAEAQAGGKAATARKAAKGHQEGATAVTAGGTRLKRRRDQDIAAGPEGADAYGGEGGGSEGGGSKRGGAEGGDRESTARRVVKKSRKAASRSKTGNDSQHHGTGGKPPAPCGSPKLMPSQSDVPGIDPLLCIISWTNDHANSLCIG